MYEIILYITLGAGVLPCAIWYLKNSEAKRRVGFILPLLWLTALASIYETVGSLILQWDTSYWFRIYDLLEFFALSYFFFRLLGKKWKSWFLIFPALFICSYFGTLIFNTELNALQSKAITSTIVVIFVSTGVFIWFGQRFKNRDKILSTFTPVLLFTIGILLYYTSTYFLFLTSNELFITAKDNFENYWMLNLFATLVFRLLLITGVWLTK